MSVADWQTWRGSMLSMDTPSFPSPWTQISLLKAALPGRSFPLALVQRASVSDDRPRAGDRSADLADGIGLLAGSRTGVTCYNAAHGDTCGLLRHVPCCPRCSHSGIWAARADQA